MRLNRFQFGIALITILILRLTIGYHFFNEGLTKLESGDFKAENFLASAKGPMAPYFHQMVEDHDHLRLLSYNKETGEVDPKLTLYIWKDYKDRVAATGRFGDERRIDALKNSRENLLEKIKTLRSDLKKNSGSSDDATNVDGAESEVTDDSTSVDATADDVTSDDSTSDDSTSDDSTSDNEKGQAKLERLIEKYEQQEQEILAIREQASKADAIYKKYSESLRQYLAENDESIRTYFAGRDRLVGFEKDGLNRDKVAVEVPSLASQVDKINSDLSKESAEWVLTIEDTWDSYENEIRDIALEEDRKQITFGLDRPHDKGPMLNFINKAIPWFDLCVGVLLFIGLFTRFTALAAAAFLASVIATQLPWVVGPAATYYQCVELAALLVLAGTAAGRIAGLDYFVNLLFWKRNTDTTEENE